MLLPGDIIFCHYYTVRKVDILVFLLLLIFKIECKGTKKNLTYTNLFIYCMSDFKFLKRKLEFLIRFTNRIQFVVNCYY